MDLFVGHYKKIVSLLIGPMLLLSCTNESSSVANESVPPKIQRVSSSKDIYGLGHNIEILLNFDKKVLVHSSNGAFPRVLLLIGSAQKYANYSRGSGTQELVFTYTVVAGNRSDNGIEISSPVDLNGASIKGEGGGNAILTINSPGPLGRVDSSVPTPPSTLSLHEPSTSPGSDPTPQITVSGVGPDGSVELYSDSICSTSISSSVLLSSGQSSVTIASNRLSDDGAITYYAKQTDPAGNVSSCSSTNVSYVYDGIPTAPSGVSLHDPSGSPGNDLTPEMTVSGVEVGAGVKLYSDSTCSTSISSSVLVPGREVKRNH